MPPIDILARNQKLFDMFKSKFSSLKTFPTASKKFGPWLQSERAYYPQARTQIVQILLIAEDTLRRVALEEPTQYQAVVSMYAPIISSLVPFHDKFVEPELHDAVGKLIANVAALQNPTPAFPTPLVIHTGISPSQQMHPSSSSLALALTPTTATPTSNVLTDVPSPAVTEVPTGTRNPGLGVPEPVATASGSASASPTTSALKPKRKKKLKKNDLSDLIQVDLQHRKRRPGTSQNPTEEAVQTPTTHTAALNLDGASQNPSIAPAPENVHMDVSTVDSPSLSGAAVREEAEPQQTTGIVQILAEDAQTYTTATATRNLDGEPVNPSAAVSAQPDSADTDKSPLDSLLLSASTEVGPMLPDGHPVDPDIVGSKGVVMGNSSPLHVSVQLGSDVIMSEDVRTSDSQNQFGPHLSPSILPASAPTSTSEALTPALNLEVDRVLRKLAHPAKLTGGTVSSEHDATINAVIPDVAQPSSPEKAIPSVPPSPHNPSPSETAMDTDMTATEEMVETLAESGALQAERQNLVVAPSLDKAALKSFIETMVTHANDLIASSTSMPISVNHLPPPHPNEFLQSEGAASRRAEGTTPNLGGSSSTDGLADLEEISTSRKTGVRDANIITRHRGLASGTITVEIIIKENQIDSIMKWNKRAKHPESLEKSLCVSLLCFLSADVKARVESTQSSIEILLPELECSWPETGGLSMSASWKGGRVDFSLAPPFALPLNGLVDLSPFLVLGKNTFTIDQTRDMSKYLILICAHYPTASQLDVISRRKRSWTGWLHSISQPFQLPFRVPAQA